MVTFGGYWLGVAFFMLLDYAQRPHFLYKYKINPGTNAPPQTTKVIKVNGLHSRIVPFHIEGQGPGITKGYLYTQ